MSLVDAISHLSVATSVDFISRRRRCGCWGASKEEGGGDNKYLCVWREAYIANPPAADWDGVERMTKKSFEDLVDGADGDQCAWVVRAAAL